MLCAGVDIFSLQKLMGHATLDVLRRYLALLDDDARAAHAKGGPVDRLLNF
jgi:integrase/recombinase XerD